MTARPKILLVDDEPAVTQALVRALRHESFDVLTVNSAQGALDVLAKQSIDVVVSDEQMPGMSGSELLATVRQRNPETIRMMLTGNASLDLTLRAINEGHVFGFLTKPCEGRHLASAIRQALQHRQLIGQSSRLLHLARRQSDLLDQLQAEHPGITEVKRDESGAIVIDEDAGNIGELLTMMDGELQRGRKRLGDESG